MPTTRGTFSARLTQIRLNKIWMTRGEGRLAGVLSGCHGSRSCHGRLPHRMQGCGRCTIVEQNSRADVLIVNNSDLMHRRTGAAGHWVSISLTRDELGFRWQDALRTRTGCGFDGRPGSGEPNLDGPVALSASADRAACRRGRRKSGIPTKYFGNTRTTSIHVTVRCLDEGSPLASTQASRNHTKIIRRLEELVIEVSFSTVVSCRYLRGDRYCPRPNLALLLSGANRNGSRPVIFGRGACILSGVRFFLATSETATVTQTALDHGCWELRRFSDAVWLAVRRGPFGDIAPDAAARSLISQPKIY